MSKPQYWTIAKFLKGEASLAEEQEIKQWIDSSIDNKNELDQLKSIWDSYEDKGSTFEPELSKAWDKIESELETSSKLRLSPWFYRVAAVLVLGFGFGYFIFNETDSSVQEIASIESATINAENTIQNVELPDGTVVTLNKGATIAYGVDFGSTDRKVELSGEAFFDVKRDEERPFIIKTASTTTQVLGTSFSVNPGVNDVIVTVVSGKVSFESNDAGENVLLTKGEQGSYSRATKTIFESANEDLNFLSWKTGELIFEDASISKVVKDLERHYRISIELENNDISRLTATFDNQSIDEVLGIISATLDIEAAKVSSDRHLIRQ